MKPEVDYFDGEGFYAARAEKGWDKLYIFGWCGTKTGEWDFGGFDWGGNLVTHELAQLENGELLPKIVSKIDENCLFEIFLIVKIQFLKTNTFFPQIIVRESYNFFF